MDVTNDPWSGGESSPNDTARPMRLLTQTVQLLSGDHPLESLTQTALEAARELCGASAAMLFYEEGSARVACKVSGMAAPALDPEMKLPQGPAWGLDRICREDDLSRNPVELAHTPFGALYGGETEVRSYLGVPVAAAGRVLGGIFFAHPEAGRFGLECEDLMELLAAQLGTVLSNHRLKATLEQQSAVAAEAVRMQRSLAERMNQVLESTSDGVALLDREWRFLYVNAYTNELVAPGRNLIGMSLWELFPEDVDGVFHRYYREAMHHGRTVEFTECFERLRLWVYVRVFPTPDGIAIFFQDVTRQKESEHAMAKATSRLRHALNAGQLGTWEWDRETDLIDLDERAADLYGVNPHSRMTRRELRERALLPEDLALTPADLSERLDAGGEYYAEYRVRTPQGLRWIAATGTVMFRHGTGEVAGMSGTVQNITARKAQEATLRQSEKLAATGRLAATIAHEINNPLEAVTNLIFLARTDPEVPAGVRRMLETADSELARVAQIAQQTLGFYRDTTRPSNIDVSGLLAGVVDLFSRKLLSRQVQCMLEVPSDLRITGLQGEIRQVFSNLLVNAIDASAANSTIRVRGRNAFCGGKPGVSVLISDQGTGIPHTMRDRLFSPFFTTKEALGTGLGLWVTRGIVEKQGGCIAFRSCTEPPTGTVFRVFLPGEVASTNAEDVFGAPRTRFLQ